MSRRERHIIGAPVANPKSSLSAMALTRLRTSFLSRGQRKRPASHSFAAANIQKPNLFATAATQSCEDYMLAISSAYDYLIKDIIIY
jgi:hypothetical protein